MSLCFTVDCGWSSWTQWSTCSRTCDVGVRRRYRSGTNPPQAFGGRPCKGERVGIDTCSVEPCLGGKSLFVIEATPIYKFYTKIQNSLVISLKVLKNRGARGRSVQ